ncbi:MAG: hypothetical protein E6G50_13540 [Actinobacteria bacterium]|nr:MAG: hypothetical protein E6G50_13540 [Actinomycetota bacterium]
MTELAAQRVPFTRAYARELPLRWFSVAVAANAAVVAGVLGFFLHEWPPHEDETLALFVGRGSLTHVVSTVVTERGGAPLHFVLAWLVVHLGGGLTALRVVSLVFAVASVPAIAILCSQLADRLVGVVSALLASGTWVLLFHGIYGRMYSLFLFTSALSFIALLRALDRRGKRRGECRRAALGTLAVVAVAATPFWWADVVLRRRFDVGVGGRGSRLGSPSSVLHYFWWVSGDFSAGHHAWSTPVLLLAALGFVLLALRRNRSALLIACVIAVPAIAFMLARLHATASPEARHLIFALPFFSILLATAVVDVARMRPPVTAVAAAAALVVLLVGEVRWAHAKTPALFDGDPPGEAHARVEAAAWLASTSRQGDVEVRAAARGSEPVRVGVASGAGTARPRRLGLRRERHDESVGARDDPVRRADAGVAIRSPRLRPVPRHPQPPSAGDARELHRRRRGRHEARPFTADRQRGREPAHDARRGETALRPVGLELSLPLHDLAIARRPLERGQTLRRPPRRLSPRTFAVRGGDRRRRAHEPAEDEGREAAAPTVAVHGTIMACESSVSAICCWT